MLQYSMLFACEHDREAELFSRDANDLGLVHALCLFSFVVVVIIFALS